MEKRCDKHDEIFEKLIRIDENVDKVKKYIGTINKILITIFVFCLTGSITYVATKFTQRAEAKNNATIQQRISK